jgi:hypothetical protein
MTTQLPNGYEAVKVLHLTLKKKWFDMIASGEKKEEYREIKQYWFRRLSITGNFEDGFIKPDAILFRHGYAKNAAALLIECLGIEVDEGKLEWGAEPDKEYFVIKLGDILPSSPPSISNHTQL